MQADLIAAIEGLLEWIELNGQSGNENGDYFHVAFAKRAVREAKERPCHCMKSK